MSARLRQALFGERCYFCQKPTRDRRYYFDDRGGRIAVCRMCAVYAEKRVYRKQR